MVLSRRDKMLILGLGVFIALLLVYFIADQLGGYRAGIEKKIGQHTAMLNKVKVLAAELGSSREIQRNPGKIISLIGHIEQLADKNALKERLQLNRVPLDKSKGVEGVDIKLDQLNLDQIVSFLFLLENSKPQLVIDQLEIDPSFRQKDHLRLSLRVLARTDE